MALQYDKNIPDYSRQPLSLSQFDQRGHAGLGPRGSLSGAELGGIGYLFIGSMNKNNIASDDRVKMRIFKSMKISDA